MASFNRSNIGGGAWALSQVWRYKDRNALLAEILEPGFIPSGYFKLDDVVMVIAGDGCAFVCVRSLTDKGEALFEYLRSTPPQESVDHVYKRKAA